MIGFNVRYFVDWFCTIRVPLELCVLTRLERNRDLGQFSGSGFSNFAPDPEIPIFLSGLWLSRSRKIISKISKISQEKRTFFKKKFGISSRDQDWLFRYFGISIPNPEESSEKFEILAGIPIPFYPSFDWLIDWLIENYKLQPCLPFHIKIWLQYT